MRIAFVGKFARLHDEEYIARSFEMLGHTVYRVEQSYPPIRINYVLEHLSFDIIIFTKWHTMPSLKKWEQKGIKTVCWLFDLYFDYVRKEFVNNQPYFRAQHVFTTDAGHDTQFKEARVHHQCLRQGIYRDECILLPFNDPKGVVFVGSNNPANEERHKILRQLDFTWYGKHNTNQVRGMALNELYSKTKIVIGDSVYSPYYWSNRVVETLGRGGFLIHQEVPGIKEEYPHLITYKRGDIADLQRLIAYYLKHEDERREIVQKNFEWVRDRYTMEKKCAELLSKI